MGKTTAFCFGVLATVFTLAIVEPQVFFKHFEQGVEKGFKLGYDKGRKDALAANPFNYELESVCATMWVSEQITRERNDAKR
jgi:hypothetical protein